VSVSVSSSRSLANLSSYFSNVTLLTIGLGDITPTTHLGRSLFFPFAVGGIIIIGLVIGSIRNLILDTGGEKIGARIIEKERERELKRFLEKGGGQSTETDHHRRRDEFELMRKILHDASRRKRWTALCISGSVWFILWFAGAAVFQTAEKDQGWTYFESVYFAYVCLLTIGYGDFYPTSNSGKPFFVVWSLLAIPSLTILISNMSDTVVKLVNDGTIWIGNATILPGERGMKHAITYPLAKITRGKVFGDSFRATAPGLLGESHRPKMDRNRSSRNNFKKDDPESAAGQRNEEHGKREAQKAKEAEASGYKDFPNTKKDLYVVLIDEIASVTRDLNSSPPREYTFEEWMWYLKLIGEDGDYPQNYSIASSGSTSKEKQKEKGGEGEGMKTEGGDLVARQWNWVDTNSPLMGNQEEPQWVLKRLTRRLQRELRALNSALEEDIKEWKGEGGPKQDRYRCEITQ
jgi:potassium channel subfamily K